MSQCGVGGKRFSETRSERCMDLIVRVSTRRCEEWMKQLMRLDLAWEKNSLKAVEVALRAGLKV